VAELKYPIDNVAGIRAKAVMTNDSDGIPRRKTLSIKRARPIENRAAPAPRETPPLREAPPPRDTAQAEQRGGRLFALDDHMQRMQADMDKLGFNKDSSSG
jgi:hypothetical protein